MKSDPQTSPREVQQVLQQLASSQAAKEVPWRVERFSQGTQAELFRVLGGPDLAQHGWPSPLVIKLFRDASAADRAAFENEKNGLQTLRQWLPASGAEGWSLDSPRLLHASENPLALVMSAVPGVPLERWLHTQRFSPAAAEALVRALLSALQTLWDRRFLYGDINLKNILYDAAEQRLCFVDPGLPAEYFRCPDVPQEWYPMSRDLAYLLYSVAVNVKHTLARPAARNRQLLLVSLLVGIPAGIFSALHQDSWLDRLNMALMLALFSIPSFVLIPILRAVNFFALYQHGLPSLPAAGWGQADNWVMPILVLAAANVGYIARLMRSSMLEVLSQDYMQTARAKGLTQRRTIYVHGLRNALLPVATVIGPALAFLVTGAFVVESLFAIPGIGFIGVQAIGQRDYPVMQGVTVILAVAVVVMNLVTDIAYIFLDPRIGAEEGS